MLTPTTVRKKQYLLDSEDPPVRIELANDGSVTGSVHTDKGWESVGSGERKVAKNETVSIRLVHENDGLLSLEINDRNASQEKTSESLVSRGDGEITIGGAKTGKKFLFSGEVSGVRMRPSAVYGVTVDGYKNKALAIKDRLIGRLEFDRDVGVFMGPDETDSRFDEVKAILSAAGIEDVSSLSTLTISNRTTI